MDWTQDIDDVLNSIRINALLLANKHRVRYFELRDSLKWYRYIGLILGGPAARYRVTAARARGRGAEDPGSGAPWPGPRVFDGDCRDAAQRRTKGRGGA